MKDATGVNPILLTSAVLKPPPALPRERVQRQWAQC